MADTRRKLRSLTVVLGGMGLLAAVLAGCSSTPDKRCVDRYNYNGKGYKVVAQHDCTSTRTSVNAAWYYGGHEHGNRVSGGSFTKPGKGYRPSHRRRHSVRRSSSHHKSRH